MIRGLVAASHAARLDGVAREQLAARRPPVELEADLHYPGAPASRGDLGGETVRRLLDAYTRAPEFAQFAVSLDLRRWMENYFAEPAVLSRSHHNCVMTKHPRYGSLTGWHRDCRYWAFEREDLVSVWLALGREEVGNGALWFVPGSHRMIFDADRFDADKFFRSEPADNQALLRTSVSPRLEAGDAVFFHANTLHSAGKNTSDAVKFSLVFTYHGLSNRPLPGSRSASTPEVTLR